MFGIEIKRVVNNLAFGNLFVNQDYVTENDLFVTVKYGDEIRRTTTKWDVKIPIWNEFLTFPYNKNVNSIIISLLDDDMYSKNECFFKDEIKLDKPYRKLTVYNVVVEYGFYKYLPNDKYNSLTIENRHLKSENNKINYKLKLLEEQLKELRVIKSKEFKLLKKIFKL